MEKEGAYICAKYEIAGINKVTRSAVHILNRCAMPMTTVNAYSIT